MVVYQLSDQWTQEPWEVNYFEPFSASLKVSTDHLSDEYFNHADCL